MTPEPGLAEGRAARRRHRRRIVEALSPLWATLGLVFLYVISIIFLINICPAGTCSPPDIGQFMREQRLCDFGGAWQQPLSVERASLWPGRLLWVFISLVNVLACLVAVLVSLRLIAGSVSGTALAGGRAGRLLRGPWVKAAPLGLLFVSFVPLLLGQERKFLPQVYDILNCAPRQDLPSAPFIGYLTIVVSLLPLACLVLASCVIIWPPREGRRQKAQSLARRMELLLILLYAGTAALVTTVLRISMTFRWGLSHLSPGPEGGSAAAPAAKVMESFATAFISTQAGSYTLFLAAVYVPAFFVLRGRAAALAGHLPAPKREEWLKTRGLAASFSEHLPRIVAILGPFLAGPLGDLIGFLTK